MLYSGTLRALQPRYHPKLILMDALLLEIDLVALNLADDWLGKRWLIIARLTEQPG